MARATFPRTLTRGPLVGQRFTSQQEYMNARARSLGFASYSAERTAKKNPLFVVAMQSAREKRGENIADSIRTANRLVGGRSRIRKVAKGKYVGSGEGREMARVIKLLYDEGLYEWGQDVDERDFYE